MNLLNFCTSIACLPMFSNENRMPHIFCCRRMQKAICSPALKLPPGNVNFLVAPF